MQHDSVSHVLVRSLHGFGPALWVEEGCGSLRDLRNDSMYVCMHVCTDGWTDGCVDAWLRGCRDGPMQKTERMDKQKLEANRWVGRYNIGR